MAEMNLQQAMELALQRHRAGDPAQAEAIYRQILAAQPGNADALHLLGVVQSQAGRHEAALELIQRAVAIGPRTGDYHASLGRVLAAMGRRDQAIAAYRTALSLNSNLPACHNALGIALLEAGRPDEAVLVFQQALSAHPDYAEFHYNLGNALRGCGRNSEAILAYRRAIRIRGDMHPAWENLANALQEAGDLEGSIQAYRQALVFSPNSVELHSNLGNALQKMGKLDESIAEYELALRIDSRSAKALNNLGSALLARGEVERATTTFSHAIEMHSGAGSDEPEYAIAHSNLGMARLLQGDFVNGWPEYEWRTRLPEVREFCQDFPKPRWDGESLNGRTILLHAEQGAGDTIQFARYAPIVSQRGGNVILQCQPDLVRLLSTLDDNVRVIGRGEPLPSFDVHCPLLSISGAIGTTLETIPSSIPYLWADPEAAERWRMRMSGDGLKVGLAWAGRSTHENDRNRSMALAELDPLLEIGGVRWFSLQKGMTPSQGRTTHQLTDWTRELGDFADTAALMQILDLVITVDTSVAHLAGALGRRVWVMLPFMPDWRWLLGREDSPWYPGMRLIRQPGHGQWSTVIRQIQLELLDLRPA